MKKVITALLIILVLPVLSACNCKHEWQEATCTLPKTCSKCGETEGSIVHNWEEATCISAKTCSICGETEGSTVDHKYSDWKTISTMDRNGSKTITEKQECIYCGDSIRRERTDGSSSEKSSSNSAKSSKELEAMLIDYLIFSLDDFKNPSSVKLIKTHKYDDSSDTFYVTLSAENGYGGSVSNVYEITSKKISKSSQSEDILSKALLAFGLPFSCDISAVNSAIEDYCEDMGW